MIRDNLSSAGDGDVLSTTSARAIRELQKPANDHRPSSANADDD